MRTSGVEGLCTEDLCVAGISGIRAILDGWNLPLMEDGMKGPCERFEYTVQVKLVTQFPNPGIDRLVQQVLGPWCVESDLVEERDTEEDNDCD